MSGFLDYFSSQAAGYAEFRPRYPGALFEWLAAIAPDRALAWDCATGNGQAALGLAEHFARVVATDASVKQLASAFPHPRVTYHQARADASGLETHSADLVTVAQALHWLPLDAFYAEVSRVLVPGGVIAVWCYDLARVDPATDGILDHFYRDIVGAYWTPERRLVDEHYRTVWFPFAELTPPPFTMEQRWTRDELLGFLHTWSAVRRYVERVGEDPVRQVEAALTDAWPNAREVRTARWTLYLRVGRVPQPERASRPERDTTRA